MTEKWNKKEEGIEIPKVVYEGSDTVLKEQVVHYEKGTRRIVIFTIVGLLMGWFSYRYYGENFLPLRMILAVPYKLSELLHNALHTEVLWYPGAQPEDAFFPQAPYVSLLAEYGTSVLFGGAVYGSLAYFTGDKRIFTLSGYIKFGCIWAAVIGVWTAALFGANAWQAGQNNALKNVSGFFIEGEVRGSSYWDEKDFGWERLMDTFYEGDGPVEIGSEIRDMDGELYLGLWFGDYLQGAMDARIHPELGYVVTDRGRVYRMPEAFMEVYRECLEVENRE